MEQGYDEEDEVRVYEHKRMYYQSTCNICISILWYLD